MDKERIIEGMMLVSTLVEDADKVIADNAKDFCHKMYESTEFMGYRFDTILVGMAMLMCALTETVNDQAKEEGVHEDSDSRH